MSDSKPRRWFQIQLSTAIVLMIVSAVLVWGNLSSRRLKGASGWVDTSGKHLVGMHCYGWPKGMFFWGEYEGPMKDGVKYSRKKSGAFRVKRYPFDPLRDSRRRDLEALNEFNFSDMTVNALVALSILVGTAFASEYIIRRSHRPAQDQAHE